MNMLSRILIELLILKFLLQKFQCLTIKEKIVGGKPIDISEVPYQCALLYCQEFICGGTIIHPYWIVTAGHCVKEMDPNKFSVRVGSSEHDKGGIVIKGAKVICNENFDTKTLRNDIALIKLSNSLEPHFGSTINLVKLADEDSELPNSNRISGWGLTKENGKLPSSTLKSVLVTSFGKAICKKDYGKSYDALSMFCAGRKKGGADACQGDSGGPCVSNNTIHGVVSFGVGCGRAKKPGVYTRMSCFNKWVNTIITNNS